MSVSAGDVCKPVLRVVYHLDLLSYSIKRDFLLDDVYYEEASKLLQQWGNELSCCVRLRCFMFHKERKGYRDEDDDYGVKCNIQTYKTWSEERGKQYKNTEEKDKVKPKSWKRKGKIKSWSNSDRWCQIIDKTTNGKGKGQGEHEWYRKQEEILRQ